MWDDALLASRFAAPNRLRFLLDSLEDLDAALRSRGAGLVVRRGDVVGEAMAWSVPPARAPSSRATT